MRPEKPNQPKTRAKNKFTLEAANKQPSKHLFIVREKKKKMELSVGEKRERQCDQK